MDFNLKAHCDFDYHNFCCALPKDTVDVEMTIWMVDGIHTYRRDRTAQVMLYSPWSGQVNPFSSLRKKITKYKEEKMESCKKKTFNPLAPVRENTFGKKRSRRLQKSRKYRKLDIGCSSSSTATSTWATMSTTTTMVNLSVPYSLPSISNVPSVPKPPVHRPPYKTWEICNPTAVPLSSPVHSDWSSEEDWDGTKQKRERESARL